MIEGVELTWSGSVPKAPEGVQFHGTPVADFLQHIRVAGLSRPACHPALHEGDLELPNSLCHFPLFEELTFLSHEEEQLPPDMLCIASFVPQQPCASNAGAPAPLSVPELLKVKLAPGAHPHLEEAQLQELHDLCFEYVDVFSTGTKLGCIPPEYGMEFRLKLKEGSKAVKQRPYSMSKFEEDWLKGELDKMFKLDVLTEVADPEWLSPVVIAKHPQSGKLRLCLDMRQLNACTELQPHPIPKVEEVVNSMTGCQFFSQIDISKGFWHIPVAAEDIPTLGFATPWGTLLSSGCLLA